MQQAIPAEEMVNAKKAFEMHAEMSVSKLNSTTQTTDIFNTYHSRKIAQTKDRHLPIAEWMPISKIVWQKEKL